MSLKENLTSVNISHTIHDFMNQFSFIRQISKKIEIKSNSIEILQTDENFQSGWVAYDEERNETTMPTIKKLKINCHELYAQPMIAQQIVDDSIINIEKWISDSISKSFIEQEEQSFLFGTNDNQPQGITSCQTKFNTVEDNLSYASLLKFINLLPDHLYKNGKMIMHRETLYEIQKIQDINNRNIYQSKISDSIPESILGIEVIINNNMPSISKPKENIPIIIFGNFSEGYLIVDRSDINILEDCYTKKPFIAYYAIKRVGGAIVNNKAFAFFKLKNTEMK